MAKYQVECPVCNSSRRVSLFGKIKDREWKLENFDWTCEECREEQFRERCRKESEAAAAANAETGLSALEGSEKQIAWAETIRAKILDGVNVRTEEEYQQAVARLEKAGHFEKAEIQAGKEGFDNLRHAWECQNEAIKRLKAKTSAHWWIENRDNRWNVLVERLAVEVSKESGVEDVTPEAESAKVESTVRPESPITETVAEIRLLESSIEVLFPEKREDFWKVIKKQLGYYWSENCWKKDITATTTGMSDFAAETGNTLLSAGFIICIFDEDIRNAAASGNFVADSGRWISKRIKGDYEGWFAIRWNEDSQALYNAARKLPGSKWSKPDVVVRPEHFEQVLDFADMYEFNLSAGAQDLVEEAQSAKDAAMTASVSKVEHDLPQPGAKPRKLAVPESVEVADEFKD
jgi:hypothetical protein